MPARHQHAEARASGIASRQVERVSIQAAPRALPQQALELALLPQPARGIQPEALAGRDYNPSRRRPRARRLRRTLRPPGVRLRTRKPWRRARRVLEGW
jgi:hypothetical protein